MPTLQDSFGQFYTPAALAAGSGPLTVSATGNLLASIDPLGVLIDTFDGASFDANKWTAAGTVPPTCSSSALINPGTTASASSSLVSVPIFTYLGGTQLTGFQIQLETPIATGNHRFFGRGTQPGTWTALLPLQDAVGIEIDPAGIVRASVYSAGVRVATTILAVLADGASHAVLFATRPGLNLLYIDNFSALVPIGLTTIATPSVENLPARFHSINGIATTTGTPTMTIGDFAYLDASRPSVQMSDGLYPFRKSKVLTGGEQVTSNAQSIYAQPTNIAYSSTTDTAFSAANTIRRQYIVSNDTTSKLYLLIDPSGAAAASATNYTYAIPAGGTFEMPNPLSTGRVRGFWATGGAGTAAITDISSTTVLGGS
jgi:hypothetical protein